MIILRVLAFAAGVAAIAEVLKSAVQVLVVPRGISDRLARIVFLLVRAVFDTVASFADTYDERDSIMAFYAPLALISLVGAWLVLVFTGYMMIDWSIGVGSWDQALAVSGSSLLTLGFATPENTPGRLLTFTEAGIGLLLVALLITYLPTIYNAWSRRELVVAALEVRAGSPPSGWEMIIRYHRLQRLSVLTDSWSAWETWFLEIEESHTTLASLPFFRSAQPDRSWVTSAGVVLDAAALISSTVDVPRDPQCDLCIRAGYIALRRIAAFFRMPYDPDPAPDAPISVTREEFEDVYDQMAAAGVPLKPNRDRAWRDFAGWRVTYDVPLLGLAALTMAPYAPWISDRSVRWRHPYASLWDSLRA